MTVIDSSSEFNFVLMRNNLILWSWRQTLKITKANALIKLTNYCWTKWYGQRIAVFRLHFYVVFLTTLISTWFSWWTLWITSEQSSRTGLMSILNFVSCKAEHHNAVCNKPVINIFKFVAQRTHFEIEMEWHAGNAKPFWRLFDVDRCFEQQITNESVWRWRFDSRQMSNIVIAQATIQIGM